ncbi:hypothetical protein CCP4SC76_4400003 [Gammaproteobacteria bacterium]
MQFNALIAYQQAQMLSKVSQIAFNDGRKALKYLNKIEICDELFYLKEAVRTHVLQIIYSSRYKEKNVVDIFFNNLDTYLPGANRLMLKNSMHHIPDGWIELNGNIMPVEVKLGTFTTAGYRQLNRYIDYFKDIYKTKIGVAVANNFSYCGFKNIICVEIKKDVNTYHEDILQEILKRNHLVN